MQRRRLRSPLACYVRANPDSFKNTKYIAFSSYIPEGDKFAGHYVRVVLWNTVELMHENLRHSDGSAEFLGMHQPASYETYGTANQLRIPPRLATIHFVKGQWTLNIVVHEMTHFIMFLAGIESALEEINRKAMDVEEQYCYIMGHLTDDIYTTLWKLDPNPGYVRVEE